MQWFSKHVTEVQEYFSSHHNLSITAVSHPQTPTTTITDISSQSQPNALTTVTWFMMMNMCQCQMRRRERRGRSHRSWVWSHFQMTHSSLRALLEVYSLQTASVAGISTEMTWYDTFCSTSSHDHNLFCPQSIIHCYSIIKQSQDIHYYKKIAYSITLVCITNIGKITINYIQFALFQGSTQLLYKYSVAMDVNKKQHNIGRCI